MVCKNTKNNRYRQTSTNKLTHNTFFIEIKAYPKNASNLDENMQLALFVRQLSAITTAFIGDKSYNELYFI